MCCFTGPVTRVSNTRIFARGEPDGLQALVYSMNLASDTAVAMVLPVPVPPGTREAAVTFIDLKNYSEFFFDLASAWPQRKSQGWFENTRGAVTAAVHEPLVVQNVGDFEASFVPTVADFGRLDPRFRLPDGTWDRLPQYRTYGFVVFKLKPGVQSVQPMAFHFPRTDPTKLFFPTVHIHDGIVHARAMFDHELYIQAGTNEHLELREFEESELIARQVMDLPLCQGIVLSGQHIYRQRLHGERDNGDVLVGPA
jgi:hypothetical protein